MYTGYSANVLITRVLMKHICVDHTRCVVCTCVATNLSHSVYNIAAIYTNANNCENDNIEQNINIYK